MRYARSAELRVEGILQLGNGCIEAGATSVAYASLYVYEPPSH